MVILTLCDYYLPGFKAGGPIQTLRSMAERLKPEIQFKIITLDRDLGDCTPYPEVQTGKWYRVGSADVFYVPPGLRGLQQLYRLLKREEYDVLYMNSLCSRRFSIVPLIWRRLGWLPARPVLLAPRGECSPAALRIKRSWKSSFLSCAGKFALYNDVNFHASTNFEEADIAHAIFKQNDTTELPIIVAPDLPSPGETADSTSSASIKKQPGSLKLVFLSRISPMKNLEVALNLLAEIEGHVDFDIVGPCEDVEYWKKCEQRIATLPANIKVSYLGPVTPDKVHATFKKYHAMLLPTRGENFGHVIFEALSAGCPVVLSDQTPWRNLQAKGIGWDFPLDEPAQFQAALRQLIAMNEQAHGALSRAASSYASNYYASGHDLELNRQLFRSVLFNDGPQLRQAA